MASTLRAARVAQQSFAPTAPKTPNASLVRRLHITGAQAQPSSALSFQRRMKELNKERKIPKKKSQSAFNTTRALSYPQDSSPIDFAYLPTTFADVPAEDLVFPIITHHSTQAAADAHTADAYSVWATSSAHNAHTRAGAASPHHTALPHSSGTDPSLPAYMIPLLPDTVADPAKHRVEDAVALGGGGSAEVPVAEIATAVIAPEGVVEALGERDASRAADHMGIVGREEGEGLDEVKKVWSGFLDDLIGKKN